MLLQWERILGQRLGKIIGFTVIALVSSLGVTFAKGDVCKAIIHPELIDDPRTKGLEVDFSSLDWSYSNLPLVALEGNCSVSKSSVNTFVNDETKTMIVTSSDDQNQGYFFYVGHCGDQSFCISWNGHKESRHAQWLITEDAKFRTDNSNYCFEDQKVSVCIN